MPHFQLFALGPPRLESNGAIIQLLGRKVWALLAYLAVSGQVHSRDALAALLWPDHSRTTARANLRRELSRLHSILNHDYLWVEREQVCLRRHKDFWLDIVEFQSRIDECRRHPHASQEVCSACLEGLEAAVALYSGDFMAGFSVADSPDFDEWHFFQAESLRRALAGALEKLAHGYSVQGQYEPAIVSARRLLALDTLHEPAHRHLMELYAQAGQRSAAIRQYDECKRTLQEALDARTSADTEALYKAILAKRFPTEVEQTGTTWQEVATPSASQTTVSLSLLIAEESSPLSRRAIFVGRTRELAELAATKETARRGKGQILFVIGGAGRGKTALVQEFAQQAQREDEALLAVSGHCNAHSGMGDPYLPFRELLAILTSDMEAKGSSGALSTGSARRLWEARPITIPALVEHAPDLIGHFVPAKALLRGAALAPTDARWVEQLAQRSGGDQRIRLEEGRLFAQYTAALKAIATQRPLLLILEDLHWIDAASSSLLFHLSREVGDSPILLIGTYRPDEVVGQRPERHPLITITTELKRQHGDIWLDLDELSSIEGRRFVDAYLDTEPNRLGEAFRATFFRHTGGHALFCAELLREMQERGEIYKDAEGTWIEGNATNWQTLPAKVEGVIEKRIERLVAEEQALLAIASVEGEVFTAEVVAGVQQWQERAVVQRLSGELDRQQRLVTVEALHQIGHQRLSRYRFRHYLFQQYLYQRLHATERAYLHEAVGNVLESLYGEESEQVAMQLAYHYEQAGVTEKAITYLVRAGKRANRLSANDEAIRCYQQALVLAKSDGNYHTIVACRAKVWLELFRGKEAVDDYLQLLKRAQQIGDREQELEFLLGLAHAYYLIALDDHEANSALKSRELYTRAQILVREIGDVRLRISSLLPTTMLIHFWPEYRQQIESQAQELLALSQELGDEELILESQLVLFVSSSAQRMVEMGEELIERFSARRELIRLNELHFWLMLAHYSLGNFGRGVAYCDAGIEMAGRIGVPPVQYPTLKAMSLLGLGRYGAAWEALQEEVADAAHPFGHAFKELGTGIYLFEVAAYAQAAAILEQVVVHSERLRRRWLRNWASLWFARALMRAGQVGQREWWRAKEALATVDVKEVMGFEPLVVAPLALVTRAEMALAEGKQEDALSWAIEAELLATAISYRPQLVTALEMKARVLLQSRRGAEALSVSDRALQLATEMDNLPAVWRLYVTKAETLAALGEEAAADQAWQAAATIVRQLAATIHDPELQQGFRSDPLIKSIVARVQHLSTGEGIM